MNRLLSIAPIGIRFGDYVFTAPVSFGRFSLPPRSAGLYVLLMPDPSWGPWHLQPIFFGEFGPQGEARMSPAQQMCCLRVAAGRSLYCALYALPDEHAWATSQIKKQLIERYRPVSNFESIDDTAELAHRLNSLEKKINEQDAVLKLALAAIGQMVPLQHPEPKKRTAGFRPDPAGSRRSPSRKSADGA